MLKLIKPNATFKQRYIEMIREWQEFGGPFVPSIVDFDCKNSLESLDYDALLKKVEDYSNGIISEDDKDYFESSDFYFIFDAEELIGVGEVRHQLKELGKNTLGHIACGIRPSMRQKGYALFAVKQMLDLLEKEGNKEIFLCHYKENEISPKIIQKFGFDFHHSIISEVSKKEIKCYVKKLNYCNTYFTIAGNFKTEDITQILGLTPYEKWDIGDSRTSGATKHTFARWSYGECNDYEFCTSKQMMKTIQDLVSKTKELKMTKEKYDVNMFLKVVPNIFNEETMNLSPTREIIEFCYLSGTEIDIALYVSMK